MAFPAPTGILRPSSAPRWGGPCAGSFAMEAQYPEDENSPEQREGTAAHHAVTDPLLGRPVKVGDIAPNGHPIDAEMLECGQHYLDAVAAWRDLMGPGHKMGVERKVFPHTWIHPENEGTPDTDLIDYAARMLVVLDYKYGHRIVEAYRNRQGVNYIAGVLEGYNVTREELPGWRIVFVVVQPRAYHREGIIRSWQTTGAEILPLIDELSAAARLAKMPGAPCTTGDHCRDCSAAHACPALLTVGGYAMDLSHAPMPATMTPLEMGLYRRNIARASRRLRALDDALEAQILHIITGGGSVPYWSKGYVNSRETVADKAGLLAAGRMLGVDMSDPEPATLSPAKARKALEAKGIDATVIASYIKKPTGAAKLEPVDETSAARAFGN